MRRNKIQNKLLFPFLMILIVSCSNEMNSSTERESSQNNNSIAISRNFEDLALGMSQEEMKSKVVTYFESNRPTYTVYVIYSIQHNIHFANDNSEWGKIIPKMRELENIYGVTCYFFEDKLFKVSIEYDYRYTPVWDNFISNAKQKYKKSLLSETPNRIEWDDGKTILTISKKDGNQLDHYVEHYLVSYADVAILSEMSKNEKEQAPTF